MWNNSRKAEFWRIIKLYEANGTDRSDVPMSVLPYLFEPTVWKPLDPVGYVKVVACFVIIIGGSLGNAGIILTVALTKALWKTQNIFMINLAVADAIICVFCVVPYALKLMTGKVYILGEFMCKLNGFIQMSCLISSVLTLSAISCYFFLKCVFPFRLKQQKSHNFLLITTMWLTSFLVSAPLVVVKQHTTIQWRDFNETKCFEDWPVYYDNSTGKNIEHKPLREAYFLIISITLFFVPVTIMFALNTWLIVQFWTDKAVGETKENQGKRNLRNVNVTIRFIIIFLAFIICWTPTQIVMLYDLSRSTPNGLTPLPEWFPEFNWFAYYIAYANSLLNPIIYSFYNRDLKRAFLKMIHCAAQSKRDFSIITYTTSVISNVTRRLSRTLSSSIKSSSSRSTTESEMCETANNPNTPVRKGPCPSNDKQRVDSV